MYNNIFEGTFKDEIAMSTVEERKKNHKQPTVLRTFRLSSSLDEALVKDASRKGIGKNALVNSILEKYVEWDAPTSDFNYLCVPYEMVARLINAVDKETAYSLAKLTAKSVASSLPLWFGAANLETVLKYLETSVKYTGARLANRVFREGNIVRIVVYQPFNEKGSAWTRGFNTGLMENVLGYPPRFIEHANSIEIIIEMKSEIG